MGMERHEMTEFHSISRELQAAKKLQPPFSERQFSKKNFNLRLISPPPFLHFSISPPPGVPRKPGKEEDPEETSWHDPIYKVWVFNEDTAVDSIAMTKYMTQYL
jgi:hypothetical protein